MLKMKTNTLLYLIASLALCSCNNAKKSEEKAAEVTPEQQTEAENIITKTVPLCGEFTHITSVTGANIVYTQGDYNIEVTGDSTFILSLKPEIDSGVLTISMGAELNSDLDLLERNHNVTLNISAPSVRCVTLCGSGNFTSKGLWKGEKLEFGIIGSGNFLCDSIDCADFDFMSSGEGKAEYVHIKAQHIHVANTKKSDVKADVETDIIEAENVGSGIFSFTGNANVKKLYPTKAGKIEFN